MKVSYQINNALRGDAMDLDAPHGIRILINDDEYIVQASGLGSLEVRHVHDGLVVIPVVSNVVRLSSNTTEK